MFHEEEYIFNIFTLVIKTLKKKFFYNFCIQYLQNDNLPILKKKKTSQA